MKANPTHIVLHVLITGLILTSGTRAAADVKQELLGTWEGHVVDANGAKVGPIKLEITAESITSTNPRDGKVLGAGTYAISDPDAKLKTIDAKGASGQYQGKSYEGIFSLEGKTLKWCSMNGKPKSKRPTELKTNLPASQFLMVLEKK